MARFYASPMAGRGSPWLRADGPALFALCAGLAVTAAFTASSDLHFGLDNNDLELTLSTLDVCVALTVLGLLIARRRRTRLPQDEVLVDAVAILVVAVLLSIVAVLVHAADHDLLWTQVLLRAWAAALILGAAISGDRPRAPRDVWWTVTRRIGIVVVAALPILTHQLGAHLPDPIPDRTGDAGGPDFAAHPLVIALHAGAAVAVLIAAFLFSRQARRTDDPFIAWLAAGMTVLGISRLHYALYPSLTPGWVYTGDVLRTIGYGLLLVGAIIEMRAHYADQTRTAIDKERRRLARELHDGLAQELTLIRISAQPLAAAVDDPAPAEIVAAAERAEAEVRSTIDALTLDVRAPLGREVLRVARDTAVIRGLDVRIRRLDDGVIDPATRHEVLRIVREAVTNAGRHADADEVEVALEHDHGRWRLTVTDDGRGFVPEEAPRGFGLTSMRDRARMLPGTFTIRSVEGRGTTVEVCW